MGYVIAAYVVVLGSVLFYWGSLYWRADRLNAEVSRYAVNAAGIREE